MDETSKTNKIRGEAFIKQFFSGKVIDIGCGEDLVVSHAEPFDRMFGHADASEISNHLEPQSYDCVHSSHCLEHIKDVPGALRQWWGLVKPGGYLVLVVPEEDLYEQGFWPSRFNRDHKATFCFNRQSSWSDVSYDVLKLVKTLPHMQVLSAEVQDHQYLHFLKWPIGKKTKSGHANDESRATRYFKKRGLNNQKIEWMLNRFSGIPVDQTLGDALAQIQIVLRKENP